MASIRLPYIFELFSSELKAGFKKSKKFVYLSIPLGIVFGILLGIGNFQSAQDSYYSETQGSLVASIIQGALGLGFGLPILIILARFLREISLGSLPLNPGIDTISFS